MHEYITDPELQAAGERGPLAAMRNDPEPFRHHQPEVISWLLTPVELL